MGDEQGWYGEQPSAQAVLDGLACGDSHCRCARSAERGYGLTHCPAHSDSDPSFNVEEKFGTTVVRCQARCDQATVIRALRQRGLWPRLIPRADVADLEALAGAEPEDPPRRPPRPERVTNRDEAWASWEAKTGLPRSFWRELGVGYAERRGIFIFPFEGLECAKHRPWPPRKAFAKYVWDARSDLRPPLWPVPKYDERGDVLITAGETDCAVARYCGYRAYALSKGENSTLDIFTVEALRRTNARRLLFVLDLDEAGLVGAHKNAMAAYQEHMPARVVTVSPEIKLLGGKDLGDLWHFVGHTVQHFREHVDRAIRAADDWAPEAIPPAVQRLLDGRDQRGWSRRREDPQDEYKPHWGHVSPVRTGGTRDQEYDRQRIGRSA